MSDQISPQERQGARGVLPQIRGRGMGPHAELRHDDFQRRRHRQGRQHSRRFRKNEITAMREARSNPGFCHTINCRYRQKSDFCTPAILDFLPINTDVCKHITIYISIDFICLTAKICYNESIRYEIENRVVEKRFQRNTEGCAYLIYRIDFDRLSFHVYYNAYGRARYSSLLCYFILRIERTAKGN